MQPVIALFMKAPIPGRVKTRLAASIGAEKACEAYEHLAATTLANLPQNSGSLWVAFDPPESLADIGAWLHANAGDLKWDRLIPQVQGDLGTRLWAVVEEALVRQSAPSITVIGTDCPWLRPWHFTKAWDLLDDGHDVVFGPAHDGGYYLQALKTPARELFSDIPWSSPQTLAASLEQAKNLGLKSALLEPLSDVDTEADWQAWCRELAEA